MKQSGNVLFLILIAVALFAALSFAVTQSMQGGGDNASAEQAQLTAAQSQNCNLNVKQAEVKLSIMAGCENSELNYELPSGGNANPDAPDDGRCDIFSPTAGGAVPCGAYLDVASNCDLLSLELGEKCSGEDIVYAGVLDGRRAYVMQNDLAGTYTWNNGAVGTILVPGLNNSGATSTDILVGLSNGESPYAAAVACRNRGEEWFLPSAQELLQLFNNIEEGELSGTFTAPVYVSSTQNTASDYFYFDYSLPTYGTQDKNVAAGVRCMRNDD